MEFEGFQILGNPIFGFIENCRDESTKRYGVRSLLEWLAQIGNDCLVAKPGQARARIVALINKEALA